MAAKVLKIHVGSFLPHPYQFNIQLHYHSTVMKYSETKINKKYLLRNPNGEKYE